MVSFSYACYLLLCGSTVTCGIIRSPPSRWRECRFLIHFTSPMWLRGSLRNYPLPSIPLRKNIVFSYILLLLCGSAVACGIIRSSHSAAEGYRFLIQFTFPTWLRGSLRNDPLPPIPLQMGVVFSYILPLPCGSAVECEIIRSPHSTAERCRFLIHFTSPMWLRNNLRNYPPRHSAADGCRFLTLLLSGSAVACGIGTPEFRCKRMLFSCGPRSAINE
jgi:hypothetical protein